MTESDNIYDSLEAIRQRKMKLKGEIDSQENVMRRSWTQLFHSGDKKMALTPSKKFTGFLTTGTTVIDGILLGWKLYRKFKR